MVDRITFFNSISGINYPEMMVEFFDHFIALKKLVEDHGKVTVSDSSDKSISFITQFDNTNFINEALSNVQSGVIVIYNRPITVQVEPISELEIKFVLQ